MEARAFCDAAGVIEISNTVPAGVIVFASGPEKVLRERCEVAARHAYDGKTLLVPGVPEAPNQRVGIAALEAWVKWITPSFEKAGLKVVGSRRAKCREGIPKQEVLRETEAEFLDRQSATLGKEN